MKIIYLLVKTHAQTGLKYLCKTSRVDPHKYLGSGVYWRDHLTHHGTNHITEIIKECYSNDEVKYWGAYYSKLWNIVESKDTNGKKIWANLIPETGSGGATNGFFGKKHSESTKKLIGYNNKGKVRSDETKKLMSKNNNRSMKGKKHTKYACDKISKIHKNKILSAETKNKISHNSVSKKSIMTPMGPFESIIAAATHCNLSRDTIRNRIKKQTPHYYYM